MGLMVGTSWGGSHDHRKNCHEGEGEGQNIAEQGRQYLSKIHCGCSISAIKVNKKKNRGGVQGGEQQLVGTRLVHTSGKPPEKRLLNQRGKEEEVVVIGGVKVGYQKSGPPTDPRSNNKKKQRG